MWEGFAPVDASYSPPVYEGGPALMTLHNAGPGTIEARIWDQASPAEGEKSFPDRVVQLRASTAPGKFHSDHRSIQRDGIGRR